MKDIMHFDLFNNYCEIHGKNRLFLRARNGSQSGWIVGFERSVDNYKIKPYYFAQTSYTLWWKILSTLICVDWWYYKPNQLAEVLVGWTEALDTAVCWGTCWMMYGMRNGQDKHVETAQKSSQCWRILWCKEMYNMN